MMTPQIPPRRSSLRSHSYTLRTRHQIQIIRSGGQTGVDRAALDVAIKINIEYTGWCPYGRRCENPKHPELDAVIPSIYDKLRPTNSREYEERTTLNVRDANATLIIVADTPIGGTEYTIKQAVELHKPYLLTDLRFGTHKGHVERIITWIKQNNIKHLNVAGPRASQTPRIYELAYTLLYDVLTHPDLTNVKSLPS